MSRRRAERRRSARAAAKEQRIPMVPGVIPDRTVAAQQHALAAAHDHLPHTSGTQVCLALFEIADGLNRAEQLWGPERAQQLRDRVAEVGGDDPAIVFAYRRPHGSTL